GETVAAVAGILDFHRLDLCQEVSRPRAAVEQHARVLLRREGPVRVRRGVDRSLFDSGPRARQFLAEVKAVKIENAGDGSDGFARFRIKL
ncbi:hypothetical protein CN109_21610, partial [Sinorhizobium meliloti]